MPQPAHFLHTTVAVELGEDVDSVLDRGRRAWVDVEAFEVEYRRVNCFHTAVVVEVAGGGPEELARRWGGDARPFLPHLTIGTFRSGGSPADLQAALLPLREAEVGRQLVDRVTLCLVPAARATILQPWTVAEAVKLG